MRKPPVVHEPGHVIAGRYELEAFLGKGAMGEVWRATHLSLGAPVALKLIDPELIAGSERSTREDLIARFEREARAAAALQSNYVVKVTDHGADEAGVPFMAMELLHGESLASRLERVGRLTPEDTIAIVSQIARAMRRAHELGIVHRDLKPENVFLASSDGEETAKVLDFGIAKLTRSPLDIAPRATSTGQLIGTPCYMSPEQASGAKDIDHRSDLWAMAVIVYECLTGRLPFLSDNLGDLVLRICTKPLPIPSDDAPDLPASFDEWWERAASRDPAQRFQSARELVDALRPVFSDIAVAPPTLSEPGSNAELPTFAATLSRPTHVPTHSTITSAIRRRQRSQRILPLAALLAVALGMAGFFAFRLQTENPAGGATSAAPAVRFGPTADATSATSARPTAVPPATDDPQVASALPSSAAPAPTLRPRVVPKPAPPPSHVATPPPRPAVPPPTPKPVDPRLGI